MTFMSSYNAQTSISQLTLKSGLALDILDNCKFLVIQMTSEKVVQ